MIPTFHGGKPADRTTFDTLFDLPAALHAEQDLIRLGQRMAQPKDPNDPRDGADDEENPFTPAGYTYLGQFVDHDLTFDATSDLADLSSFQRAANDRSPRFDLDNVYGAGPADQPYLYGQDADGVDGTLVLGAPLGNGVPDVQRNGQGRAVIGDPRNDENAIVSQIHSAMMRFHNALAARGKAGNGVQKRSGDDLLAWAQMETRHHYQRILLDDFLPRIVDTDASTVCPIFAALAAGRRPKLRLFPTGGDPFMPTEFAMAAYRLGHSMIRPGYRLHETPGHDGALFPIFAGEADGLRGFQRLNTDKWIDWSLFFHPALPAGQKLGKPGRDANNAKNGATDPANGSSVAPHGRVQFAYKIDTMLVDPLAHLPAMVAPGRLPDSPDGQQLRSLAVRNLLRGRNFGLPSGEMVADVLGVDRLRADQLTVRGDNFKPDERVQVSSFAPDLEGSTPLWFYILAEAEAGVLDATRAADPALDLQDLGARLGPVGAAIVVETFVGLMLLDPESVLNTTVQWRSINGTPHFTMPELLRVIGAMP